MRALRGLTFLWLYLQPIRYVDTPQHYDISIFLQISCRLRCQATFI